MALYPKLQTCLERLKAHLAKFEQFLLQVTEVRQFAEPREFWALFAGLDLAGGCGTARQSFALYARNVEWNAWFCYLQEDGSSNVTRSSRSKQSLYSYAEENEKRDKCVLFVFPAFQEPLYFFDLDDLQNDGYALLVDPRQKVG